MSSKGEELLQCVQKGDVIGATALLASDDPPDPSYQDPKTGNSALHIAVIIKNEILVKQMIVFNANLQLQNHQNKTALDLAKEEGARAIEKVINFYISFETSSKGEKLLQCVQKGDVKGATALLASHDPPNPNYQDPRTGNAALHIAVIIKNEVLVKLMIVFDANLELQNNENKTPLDLAKETCIAKVIRDVLDWEQKLRCDKSKPLRSTPRGDDEVFMLSLDGGGIRGLVSIQVMIEMEKRREKLYPGSQTLLSQFNWVAGNSAGGLSTLALAGKNVIPKQGRTLLFTVGSEVLSGMAPIPNEKVDPVFKKIYGEHTMMSDIDVKDRYVCVMTTLSTQSPAALHIMSNYGGARHEGTDPPEKQLMWKAARATSAVPIFFHPQDGIYLDGGLIANNPVTDGMIDMYDYAKKQNKKVDLKLVLSLGCGLNKPKGIDDIDFHSSIVGKCLGKILGHFHHKKIGEDIDTFFTVDHNRDAFKDLLEIVLAQITQPNGEVLRRGEFMCEQMGASYYRINPLLNKNVSFLSTDDTELIDMLYTVKLYALKNCHKEIDPILDIVFGQQSPEASLEEGQ